ncbi:MAG: methyltransferase family protein [Daejeonella sp.]
MSHIRTKDIILVSIQAFLFLIYFLVPPYALFYAAPWLKSLALVVSLTGAFVVFIAIIQLDHNLSPFPSPIKKGTLVTSGLFNLSRHPIYSGLLIFYFGWALYSESLTKGFTALLILALFYYKSVYEEILLKAKYPEYGNYSKKTRRFFPFF